MTRRGLRWLCSLPLLIASCGRVGYDELLPLSGGGTAEGGKTGGDRDGALGAGVGGGTGMAGSTSAGGASSGSGGAIAAGGVTSTGGGSLGTGGATSAGGITSSTGGSPDSGTSSTGGSSSSGGTTSTGGSTANGGATSSGGGTSTGGAGTTGGATSTGGAGGVGNVGCADGQREGFLDLATYPNIAACDGGFTVSGVIGLTGPACARAAGDDGAVPGGNGCNAIDLCALGFHLCADNTEVAAKSSTGCTGAAEGVTPVFYVTAQPGAGQAKCGTSGTDDVYGCGSMGAPPNVVCTPLNAWSGDGCKNLTAPWSCASPPGAEALHLVKTGSAGGGVLCCRD